MCTVSAHEGKQTLYIDVLQSVLLLYLPHHLCNIRSPHSYLSPPGKSGRGIRQKRLVLWSVSLWFFGINSTFKAGNNCTRGKTMVLHILMSSGSHFSKIGFSEPPK